MEAKKREAIVLNEVEETPRPDSKRPWHAPEMHKSLIQETTKSGTGLADDGATLASTVV